MPKNSYYQHTIDELLKDKDSIMEMAKILSYDSERLVARVYTTTSKQYRDDVPVFFPSMYLNTGIISPPVINSTSLLFWGPDRQPFLLPVQFTVPNITSENGVIKVNASPGHTNDLLTLRNIEGGEHLIRSLSGAYIFIKNLGDVELSTSNKHRLALTEKDGALEAFVNRVKGDFGGNTFYLGPASRDTNDDIRTHFYMDLVEESDKTKELPEVAADVLIDAVLNDTADTIPLDPIPKLFKHQAGHVFDEDGQTLMDEEDGTELFSQQVLTKNEHTRVEQISKAGRKVITTTAPGMETKVITSAEGVDVSVVKEIDGVIKTTGIGINSQGDIVCSKDGVEYELMPMLKWFYEQSGMA